MTPLHWLLAIFVAAVSAVCVIFYKYYRGQDVPSPLPTPMPTSTPPVPANNAPQKLYSVAYANLGKHLTLDNTVPEEVGCCEAVSAVLAQAGYTLPPKGIAGVNYLISWMKDKGFQEVSQAEVGAIITAHSPDYYSPGYAHVGICGEHWIMSNSSANGLFQANYTFPGWLSYFGGHGSQTRYFRPV